MAFAESQFQEPVCFPGVKVQSYAVLTIPVFFIPCSLPTHADLLESFVLCDFE